MKQSKEDKEKSYCSWCGKEITEEQNKQYNGNCDEQHNESTHYCGMIFNPE